MSGTRRPPAPQNIGDIAADNIAHGDIRIAAARGIKRYGEFGDERAKGNNRQPMKSGRLSACRRW